VVRAVDPTNRTSEVSVPAPGKVLRAHFAPPAGDRLLTLSDQERRVRLWDGWTGRPRGTLDVAGPVREALFTPTGQVLVLDASGMLTSFDPDGTLIGTCVAFDPNLVLNGMALSPDGGRVCAAVGKGADWSVKVWDVAHGEEIAAWRAADRPVWGVA